MWFQAIKLAVSAGSKIYANKQKAKVAMSDAQLLHAERQARGDELLRESRHELVHPQAARRRLQAESQGLRRGGQMQNLGDHGVRPDEAAIRFVIEWARCIRGPGFIPGPRSFRSSRRVRIDRIRRRSRRAPR